MENCVEEIGRYISEGDYESAVRLSGEMLAKCDSLLRNAYQRQETDEDDVTSFVQAALLHVHALRLTKTQAAEQFLCAVGVLLSLEVYNVGNMADNTDKMRLYYYAIQSAIDGFESLQQTDTAESEEHRGYILSYLASMLYYYYGLALAEDNASGALSDVYQFLQAIKDSGAIQSPTIRLGEKELNPANEAGSLLVDILSRAAALGLS